MTKIEEIYKVVLPEMEEAGLEDTLANRYAFLKIVRESWPEQPFTPERALYYWELDREIYRLNKMATEK